MTPVEHHLQVPRTARYLTGGRSSAAEEVWFVLHGYSMLAVSIPQVVRARGRPGRLLVAPEALSRAYFEEERGGAGWAPPG